MVIQRGQPFPLWGSNSPSSGAVSVAYRGMTYPAAAVGSGGVAWRVVLPAHEATSEPANITITAAGWHGGAIVFTDCLVGDVYHLRNINTLVKTLDWLRFTYVL